MVTYNKILKVFADIASNHKQIKTFTKGDIFEVDQKDVTFPHAHLITNPVQITQQELTYQFQLIVMDLVEPNESNEEEVLSDTLLMIQDFVSMFLNGSASAAPTMTIDSHEYRLNRSVSCQPFTERFDTDVSGWVATLNINVDFKANACEVPIS